MKALITGINGFVGSYLAEHLLDCGDEVLGCSRRSTWNACIPENVTKRIKLVRWELPSPSSSQVFQEIQDFSPDCIYHLAAISVPADCGDLEPTDLSTAVNVNGVQTLLQLVERLPSQPRMLFVSSSQVYAPVPSKHAQVNEEAPLGPIRSYGKTKLAAEEIVFRAVQEQGLDALVARSFQHTGPRQKPRLMLPEWAQQIARGDSPVLVHSLDAHLDLSDVHDVVRAYRSLIERGKSGEVYNVGSGVNRRSGDIFHQLQQLHKFPFSAKETAPGFQQNAIAEITRITQQTGWQPKIPLEKTLEDTLAYWLHQQKTPQ